MARGLEAEWERRLRELEQAQRELTGRESQRPRAVGPADTERLREQGQHERGRRHAPVDGDPAQHPPLLAVERAGQRAAPAPVRPRNGFRPDEVGSGRQAGEPVGPVVQVPFA